MEETREKKRKLRQEAQSRIASVAAAELEKKRAGIRKQLFDFANFREAETVFFYAFQGTPEDAEHIISVCVESGKEVAVPLFETRKPENSRLFKITGADEEMRTSQEGDAEPDPLHCKQITFDSVDIALISGVAFDEKGGRLGSGRGRLDRLMPVLPNTARKVALALEDQVFPNVPMESHDRYVDIIITEKRVIYKI